MVLNWVASWHAVGELTVVSADGDDICCWDIPSDLELARMELEELLK